MTVIDRHLARFAGAQRAALQATVAVIRAALPGATEVISYRIPTFKLGGPEGISLLGLDGFRAHNSLFPYGPVPPALADAFAGFAQTKGSVHFAIDRAFPAGLLRRLLKVRIADVNASSPDRAGDHRAFHANGFLKASGKIKGGVMHGAWQWFRRDGTRLRSGAFRAGIPIGAWVTYDRAGAPRTTTQR